MHAVGTVSIIEALTAWGWPQCVKLTPGDWFQDLGGVVKRDWGEGAGASRWAGMGVYPALAFVSPNWHR